MAGDAISFNLRALEKTGKAIQSVGKDSVFAGVVALTRTAKLVQAEVKKQAGEKMKLKNSWTARGIRITPATVAKPEAEIYTKDDYLVLQDVGGKRDTRDEYWIPGNDFARVTGVDPKAKVIPKKLRRPAIFAKKFPAPGGNRGKGKASPFRLTTRSGAEIVAVRTTSLKNPLAILYLIVHKAVNIKRRAFFQEPAAKTYDKEFKKEYSKAFDKYVLKR